MVTRRTALALASTLTLLLSSGCWLDTSTPDSLGSAAVVADPLAIDQAVAIGVTRLLNDPLSTVEFLEEVVDLDWDVATGLVDFRRGRDHVDGTDDDEHFYGLSDVVELPFVDDRTVNLLVDAAVELDYVPVIMVEDVYFSSMELKATLAFVNVKAEAELSDHVDSRALDSILRARPFEAVTDLADRPYVGPATLEKLRDAAVYTEDVRVD